MLSQKQTKWTNPEFAMEIHIIWTYLGMKLLKLFMILIIASVNKNISIDLFIP